MDRPTPYQQRFADIFLHLPPEDFGRVDLEPQAKDYEPTMENMAVAAFRHACCVAVHLAGVRGPDGLAASLESYSLKNRFDSFTQSHLPDALRVKWDLPINREPGVSRPNVQYPNCVDATKVHGGAKPHRYFVSQTMRNIEFARLGKLDANTAAAFGIENRFDISNLFALDWRNFIPIIKNSKDLNVMSAGMGAITALQLLDNGLSPEQVAAVLDSGFNVNTVKSEHGDIPQAALIRHFLSTAIYPDNLKLVLSATESPLGGIVEEHATSLLKVVEHLWPTPIKIGVDGGLTLETYSSDKDDGELHTLVAKNNDHLQIHRLDVVSAITSPSEARYSRLYSERPYQLRLGIRNNGVLVGEQRVIVFSGDSFVDYWVDAGTCRQGIASRTTRALARYLTESGCNRVAAQIDPNNLSSYGVLQKAGFVWSDGNRFSDTHTFAN